MSYSYFYWNKYNCIWSTKVRRGCWCNMPHICQRLMRCHWSFDLRWVKSQATRSSSDHVGLLHTFFKNRHSRVKTQGVSCIGGFGQTYGQRKFQLGIPQNWGAPYIRGPSYIREKTVIIGQFQNMLVNLVMRLQHKHIPRNSHDIEVLQACSFFKNYIWIYIYIYKLGTHTVKCCYNAFFWVQEIDRVIALIAL